MLMMIILRFYSKNRVKMNRNNVVGLINNNSQSTIQSTISDVKFLFIMFGNIICITNILQNSDSKGYYSNKLPQAPPYILIQIKEYI